MVFLKDSSQSKATLVCNGGDQTDLDLPSWGVEHRVKGMVHPHLVLFLEREAQLPTKPQVNVYKMISGRSTRSLIKSLSLHGSSRYPRGGHKLISSNLLLGFQQYHVRENEGGKKILLFEKASLMDENKTEIFLRSVPLLVNMNTTSLVYSLFNPFIGGYTLFKRDFWID